MSPIFCDSHMHTPMCHHAIGEPDTYVRTAEARGLPGIIFTCHNPMPDGWAARVRMAPEELDTYIALIQRTAAESDTVEVRLGLESDWFPGMEDWLRDQNTRADFDYILGSVHYFLDEWEPLFPPLDFFDPDPDVLPEYWSAYFRFLADAAETGLFDCISHPDLVKSVAAIHWDFERVADVVGVQLDRIAATDTAMELNTSGRHKKYPEINPNPTMLGMMCERDIPVVLGSDSHHPFRVGADFEQALDLVEAAGYKDVTVFKKRKPTSFPLDDVRALLRPGLTHSYADPIDRDAPLTDLLAVS